MRRKPDTLIPIEKSIIKAVEALQEQGIQEFHGFQISKVIEDKEGAHRLTGLGTLYRALSRLEKMGKLQSRWEEQVPANEHRPRRRYYRMV